MRRFIRRGSANSLAATRDRYHEGAHRLRLGVVVWAQLFGWHCTVAGTATNTFQNTPSDANIQAAPGPVADANAVPGPQPAPLALKQSGSGWPGNVNVASTSANYEGMSLEQLLKSEAGIGQALRQHPEIVSAITKVNGETQVPGGLIAGVIYQESGFDATAVSNNPNPTLEDSQDIGLCQCPQSDFSGDTWKDPYTNIRVFVTKYFLPDYLKNRSWGIALRNWNTGEVLDPNDLSKQRNNTDPNYLVEILATHCMGLD
jgi:hypothetical protein